PTALYGEEEMFVRRVQVPRVVGMVLVIPLHAACINIESEDRIRVQVIALAHVRVPGCWVAHPEECQVQRRVVGRREPDGPSAILPRLTRPRLYTGFPRRWNRVGPPQLLTAVRIEGGDEAAYPHLTGTTRAQDNFPLHRKRGHGEEIAIL